MMSWSAIALTLLATSLLPAPPRPPRQGPAPATFRAEARVVVVQVAVHGRHGESVTGLDRRAFSVFENGRPQPIALFLRDAVPVSLGVVLDNSGSMQARRAQVEAAALAFARAAHPGDELFVVNFADKARLDVAMTGDRRALEAGMARTDAIGGTALRDAVDLAITYLDAHATCARKALLVISDGNDNASVVTPERIREQAERTGIAIYAIGLPHDDPAKARRGHHDLDELTEGTGGLAAHLAHLEEIEATAQRLAQEIRTQYTLAYTPVNQALDGSYRRIRVTVQGPDRERLSVRARTGYYATTGRVDDRRPSTR
jgi:Ca-activated chloride channel family protein